MEIYHGPDRKEKYRNFCEKTPDIPVFIRPWWLNADAGPNGWDVVLVQSNRQIVGALPYCFTKIKIFNGIGMPPVAPYQGYYIFFKKDHTKTPTRIKWENKIVALLFSHLPKHTFFYQHFPPEIKNWMPLYWMNYRQTTRYSYIIDNIAQPEVVFNNFEKRTRYVINKAKQSLSIYTDNNAEILIELIKQTYKKQNIAPPYDFEKLKKLTKKAVAKKAGKIYVVQDNNGNTHAASFTIWDKSTAYYVIQASQPKYLPEGGASLLVWHSINDAAAAGLSSFDFTGSMMPNIEKYIRSFGGTPVQRHYISKENTFLFYWLMRLKEARKSR